MSTQCSELLLPLPPSSSSFPTPLSRALAKCARLAGCSSLTLLHPLGFRECITNYRVFVICTRIIRKSHLSYPTLEAINLPKASLTRTATTIPSPGHRHTHPHTYTLKSYTHFFFLLKPSQNHLNVLPQMFESFLWRMPAHCDCCRILCFPSSPPSSFSNIFERNK